MKHARVHFLGVVFIPLLCVPLPGYEIKAHRDILDEALRLSELCFTAKDIEDMRAGSMHEDDDGVCFSKMRFRHHGYNPVTGARFDAPGYDDELTAKKRARELWEKMVESGQEGDWNGYENIARSPCERHIGGYFHFLGRICHMLGDMASPGHAHAPDGHGGWEAIFGYDYEEYWDRVDIAVPEPLLTPLSPLPGSPSWGSRMDPQDWGVMLESIRALDATDSLEFYMRTMALVTYHHSRFRGAIEADVRNPVPDTSTPFGRMFSTKLESEDESAACLFDPVENRWFIEGIGWYESCLHSDAWWPEVDWPKEGGVPDTVINSDGSASGYFYIFPTYRQWNPEGHDGGTWPARWPNGVANESHETLAEYYGSVLIPWVVRMTRGLLVKAWPVSESSVALETSWELNIPVIDRLLATMSDDDGPCKVVADLDLSRHDSKGKIIGQGQCTMNDTEHFDLRGSGKIKGKGGKWSYKIKLNGMDAYRKTILTLSDQNYPEPSTRYVYKGPGCRLKGEGRYDTWARLPTAELRLFPAMWDNKGNFWGVGDISSGYGNDCEGDCPGATMVSGRLLQKGNREALSFQLKCGKQSVSFKGTRIVGAASSNFVGVLKYKLPPAKGILVDHEIDADAFIP